MQKFKCHKVVEAGKIVEIKPSGDALDLLLEQERVMVPAAYMQKHQPEVGGYFVRYADGYESYSPAAAFEAGYAPITQISAETLTALTGEPILQFFVFAHLPEHLQAVSRPFAEQAARIMELPRNPERTVALRKLLESKDAAVRAKLAKEGGPVLHRAQVGRSTSTEPNMQEEPRG